MQEWVMPTEAISMAGRRRPSLAGDVLWLAITAGACAMIVGIVCWLLSAELSPSAVSGHSAAAAISLTSPAPAVLPSPTFGIGRVPPPSASLTIAGNVTEGSSGVRPTTSTEAPMESVGDKSLLPDSNPEQRPNPPPADRSGSNPAPFRPQPAQSVSAIAHSPSPHRPRQQHQRARTPVAGSDAALIP